MFRLAFSQSFLLRSRVGGPLDQGLAFLDLLNEFLSMVNNFAVEGLTNARHLSCNDLVNGIAAVVHLADAFLLRCGHGRDGGLAWPARLRATLIIHGHGGTSSSRQAISALVHLLVERGSVGCIACVLSHLGSHLLRPDFWLKVQLFQECLHVGGFLFLDLLHLIQTAERSIEACVEHRVTPEHQLNSRLEGELI